jgi:lipopolysaccharide export system permease protein
MGELSTLELLSATPALVSETRTSVGMLKVEAHQRITQSLMAMVAPLIGFATLLMGGFSRFGIWNQIVAAILMIVVLKTLDNALADIALSEAAYWPLAYVAPLIGLAMAALILWLAGNPQVYRRKPKAVGK